MTRTAPDAAATLPPVPLTPEEAAAIAVALAAQPDGPYAPAGRGALEKVLAALEPDAARRAQLLATSLWVSAEAGRTAELRSTLERAVTQRRVVVLRYRDGEGRASRRQVEPQLLARSSSSWFLVAWCRERQAPRWFRADRIPPSAGRPGWPGRAGWPRGWGRSRPARSTGGRRSAAGRPGRRARCSRPSRCRRRRPP